MSAVSFTIEGVGFVEMIGEGPWTTFACGSTVEVRDSDGRVANPTVHLRFSGTTTKPNRNTVFANPAIAPQIVARANELFSAAAAPGSETQVDG